MGIVNRVRPAAELEHYVRDYANTPAVNAPLTIAAVKRCLMEIRRDPGERDVKRCQKMVDRCFASEGYLESRRAFLKKRKPIFAGR